MQQWTLQDLERITPKPTRRKGESDEAFDERAHAWDTYTHALVEQQDMLDRAGLTTALRRAHFLAQALVETGGLTIVRENMRYSLDGLCKTFPQRFSKTSPVTLAAYAKCRGEPEAIAELIYGGKTRPDLGNTEDGDGWYFRGGGFFQTTGRDNYRAIGKALNVDLEGQPDLIEDPRISLAAALWEWNKQDLNRFADLNFGRAIGNAINRGNPFSNKDPIGYDERKRWFDKVWNVIGNGGLPAPTLSLGAYGQDVVELQDRLADLGYRCGAHDGVFGNEVGRALAAFKRDFTNATGYALDPGDEVGQATRAALANAQPVRSPEREQLTAKDLLAAGSTEVAAGGNMKKAGGGLLALGTFQAVSDGARQMPAPAQALTDNLGWFPGFQSSMVPILDSLSWGIKHLFPILLIGAGVWMYAYGWTWIRKRVQAARLRLNLSR